MTTANKVKFNLKNCHYAKMTETVDSTTGKTTYAWETPKAWPGAVSLKLDPQGELYKFFADGRKYYSTTTNQGYEGDFESALVPEDFDQNILGHTLDANKVELENANVEPGHFAFMFQFDGDAKATRYVLYDCILTRPTLEGNTVEEKMKVDTQKTTLSAAPLENGDVCQKTNSETLAAAYDAWYDAVYQTKAA
ncbi:MAG: major tail protein [Atopobiaceae bacterium]|jgi:phi13 family phage major tail protein|nr:phage tail protein [Atopobiaceae bacterium]